MNSAPSNRKIVVFADGTGNAFTHQESNVWRLYQAVDQTDGNQKVFYIPGVGTSSIKPIATIDGAIGLGVPGNVRELYRFICWNWEPGVEIWMFGFSRGAFTIRTLAGLINHEGLMPREVDDQTVTEDVMTSNSEYAWRSYRRKTAPANFFTHTPIWVSRALLGVYWRLTSSQKHFDAACKELDKTEHASRRKPEIKLLGLFDTVEAFGMPVEELRPVVNQLIWPISFRNEKCAAIVKNVRHALAIDDERTTFHPVRFDQRDPPRSQSIKEVWFPGMHSDVGGGYPDDALAMVPLHWMATEAAALDLRLKPEMTEQWASRASPLAPLHDSRAGAGVLYRYDPRRIGDGPEHGGPPVLHHSVAMRVADDASRYGPINMPDNFVLTAQGDISDRKDIEPLQRAMQKIRKPDQTILEHAADVVWWRRLHYFVMLWSLLLLAALPWVGWLIPSAPSWFAGSTSTSIRDGSGEILEEVGGVLTWLLEAVGSLAPASASAWFDAFKNAPAFSLLLMVAFIWMYLRGLKLQRQIRDISRIAWRKAQDGTEKKYEPLVSMAFARAMRTKKCFVMAYRAGTRIVLPIILAAALGAGLIAFISRSSVNAFTESGRICRVANPPPEKVQTRVVRRLAEGATETRTFDAASPCWASGIQLRKDVSYKIRIVPRSAFTDRSVITTLMGFPNSDGIFEPHGPIAARLLKRWPNEPWFQLIYQVGKRDGDTGPLRPLIDRTAAQPVEKLAEHDSWGNWASWRSLQEPMRQSAEDRLKTLAEKEPVFEAVITPKIDGELHLYVNDAMFGVPFLGASFLFYRNNAGLADVSVSPCQSPCKN